MAHEVRSKPLTSARRTVAAVLDDGYLRPNGSENEGIQMLSGEALDLAFALRARVGALSQGDGPTLQELRRSIDLSEHELQRALSELEGVGFIGIQRHSEVDAAIVVLAPLQIYLDDLESQGTDDL